MMSMLSVTASDDKRRFMDPLDHDALDMIVSRISYGGNPEHKRNPGDFGLMPPSQPRPDKSLCDEVGIFKKAEAERLLLDGVKRGMISQNWRQGFPQNIWAVTEDGIAVEAQLENAGRGTYHGYPMPSTDHFAKAVVERWDNTNG
ncbi:hypothetical protein Plut_0831 [Pelodictyon luteolum DSM 273]|uniref:Uncharacterized protein n=2 Tax=Pelodictyon luteolum TaxID=1100 RepID=Q3B4N3_CHLL3|nr:hypothetical protein Plut_0831 [Pelodictyon luteolum DSM 273]